MGDKTNIEWTDATVNFWWGCTKVGPGCDHCYAEKHSDRFSPGHWGSGAPRRKIKGAAALLNRLDNGYAWWAADAEIGRLHPNSRRRVFIQSMSDLFDMEVPLDWFAEAWAKIVQCDRIDIQIVTKRISAVEKRLASIDRTTWPKHVGLMVTVTSQKEANRDVPRLLHLKAKLGIPWVGLSIEPMLGPIDFTSIPDGVADGIPVAFNALASVNNVAPRLDWIIVGGESGPKARPMHPDWVRSLRDQCADAGIAFFFKQWGEWLPEDQIRDGQHPGPKFFCLDGNPLDQKPPFGPSTGRLWHWWEPDHKASIRVGKARASRLIDGVRHDARPVAPEMEATDG